MNRYFDKDICEDLVTQILTQLDDTVKNELARLTEAELIDTHFGLGMWIRNTYFYEPEKRWVSVSPDDDSMKVVEAIWRTLKKRGAINERWVQAVLPESKTRSIE